MKTRRKTASPNKEQTPSTKPIRKSKRSEIKNANEVEYDYIPSSNRSDQQTSSPIVHLIQTNIPPLSNYEQKQIVEGLLHHTAQENLTFEEAQTYAVNKAIEIGKHFNLKENKTSPFDLF